jgi:subtilisin family serine protease
MASKRVQALGMAAALVAGYTGAAAFSAWAEPPLEIADGFGPGDGLTRYVVTAASGAVTDDLLGTLENAPGVVSAQSLPGGSALVATESLAPHQLEALPGVADAEFSTSVPVLGTISDPYFPQYGWNLENTGSNAYNQLQTPVADADVDATSGWDGGTGAGRIVAVVDSGFDTDHPDLAGSLWTNPAERCGTVDTDRNGLAGDCHGWNFYANNADLDNAGMSSHGTAVSGIVGARANNGLGSAGVAPNVTIMPLVIGGGDTVDVNLGAKAIRYAVDHGADVINASWGGAFAGSPLTGLRNAVAYAAAHDVLVVAAAGNDAENRDTNILYPASLPDPNVITVGSSNAADGISPSSAYGATSVDLFAPGYLVATTWNDGGVRLVGGTSMSAPHVAAAVALYRAQLPDAGYADIKAALLADVDPVPAFAGKSVTGGRLTVAGLGEPAPGDLGYRFTSMTAPAGVVTPGVHATGTDADGHYSVTLGLGMDFEEEIWAVADKEVTLGGSTLTTDDAGEATFDLGAGHSLADLDLSPSLELGDGRYVLTVALYRDGNPVGRTVAAPLLVGGTAEEAPGGQTPGGDAPGSTPAPGNGGAGNGGSGDAPSGDDAPDTPETPGDDGAGTPVPGVGGDAPDGAGHTPGDSDGADQPGDQPGADVPGDAPDGSDPDLPGGSDAPGSDAPGTGPQSPSTDAPDSPDGDAPAGDVPATDGPGEDDSAGGPAPDDGGSVTFPSVGAFSITGMTPVRVSTVGGTRVQITGTALPAGARVLIGDSAAAQVVSSSATQVVFRAPARVAGAYDVTVFAPDGRAYTLEEALTYADDAAAPGGSGTPSPGSDPAAPGDGPAGDDDGADPTVVRTGPHGERLVRSTTFAGLAAIWNLDCATSCSGMML